LKSYYPGESFGELALLYNCPRAASIQAKTTSRLFALDRDCFNHIVKGSAIKKREQYEELLKKIKILEELDPYERTLLSDSLQLRTLKPGEVVISQVCSHFMNQHFHL